LQAQHEPARKKFRETFMAQWGKLKYAQQSCLGQTGKLMQQTGMAWPGARIGLAVSGGMDSWVMLQVMTMRQRIMPFPVELFVIHLNPGFDPSNHTPLAEWMRENGVAGHLETTDFGPRAHSEENRKKSPCFFCAWHRRKRLFDLCRQYNLTHLALGHNTDDLVSTFFMNMLKTGKIYGLVPKESYFGGRLTLIRPLLLLEKAAISQACRQWKLPVWENDCPSKDKTARSETLNAALALCKGDKRIRTNMFNALRRWQTESWPGMV
jgi:tRNA(Ile)-lysidine synthase TilS/MesJ